MTPPPIIEANIGMWDTLILMGMALVVFGPRRLPEIGRQIGKLMYELRKASNEFKFQMEEEWRRAEEAKDREQGSGIREQGTGIRDQGTALAISVDSQAAEVRAESPVLQPPSTGEPVMAARPSNGRKRAVVPAAKKATRAARSESATGKTAAIKPPAKKPRKKPESAHD